MIAPCDLCPTLQERRLGEMIIVYEVSHINVYPDSLKILNVLGVPLNTCNLAW